MRAQSTRAIRLASATATSNRGFFASIRASQVPSGAPMRAAHQTTATVPVIRSRRMSRWPMRVIFPSRSRPPVECCRVVSPTQAAKSRPLAQISSDGAYARNGHEPLYSGVSGRSLTELRIKRVDPFRHLGDLSDKHSRQLDHRSRQRASVAIHQRSEAPNMSDAGRRDDAVLCQMPPQRIDRLGSLAYQ